MTNATRELLKDCQHFILSVITSGFADEVRCSLLQRLKQELTRVPSTAAVANKPLPHGCYCQLGKCAAPRIMGQQMPCRDERKAAGLTPNKDDEREAQSLSSSKRASTDDEIREAFEFWANKQNLNVARKGDGYRAPYADWCWHAFYAATVLAEQRGVTPSAIERINSNQPQPKG